MKKTEVVDIADGNLQASKISIRKIVEGNLDLRATRVTRLPAGLVVGGDLNLSGTLIESIPNRLKVGDQLYLGNPEIKKLPRLATLRFLSPC